MAITTANGKMAVMAINAPWLPNVYMTVDGITQPDQQQLLWQSPDTTWGALVVDDVVEEPGLSLGLGLGLMIGEFAWNI